MRRHALLMLVLGTAMTIQAALGLPAWAADQSGVDKLIEQTKSALQQAKKREKSALTTLSKHQRELDKIQANLSRIDKQLQSARARAAAVETELGLAERELNELQSRLEDQRAMLCRRVSVLYRYGPISYLEIVLAAGSFVDLINRYELSAYFVRRDLKLIDEYRRSYREVQKKRREIQARQEELQARTAAISALQADAKKEQQRAATRVKSTQSEVALIQADRHRLEKALVEYERLSRELGSEVRRKGSAAALGTGKMVWPVAGRLSSSFGWRRHPVLKRKKFHNGQDIACPVGTPVLAADSGVVVISGWRGGYGYLVAIDHGRGLSTFYGHNSVLLVSEGDVVAKGQQIAKSGNTGLTTGPHLHFEVRINGEPVNPLPYLP